MCHFLKTTRQTALRSQNGPQPAPAALRQATLPPTQANFPATRVLYSLGWPTRLCIADHRVVEAHSCLQGNKSSPSCHAQFPYCFAHSCTKALPLPVPCTTGALLPHFTCSAFQDNLTEKGRAMAFANFLTVATSKTVHVGRPLCKFPHCCHVTIHHLKLLRVQGGHLPGRVQGWNPWDFAFNLLPLARFSNQADALFASA